MLWNVNAADAISTPPAKTLKTVDFGKTLKMGIPKGIWKMGFSLNGERTAMPDTVEAGVNWPKLEIDTGKTYSLIIKTDEGNFTRWAYNLPLVK